MRISSVFSYYGGKSKIIKYYPRPNYGTIIEPFAGAAAYSWAYHERDVWINELDPRTFSIWQFLTSDGALDWVERVIPPTIVVGTRVSDLCIDAPTGLLELMRAEANQGTQGGKGVHNQVTSMAATCWPRLLPKMRVVIPAIRHWIITNLSYDQLPTDQQATWFVDPPYANAAGSRYRQSAIDYSQLAKWCQSISGEVIVCENLGATWLPFEPFNHRHISVKSRYQNANAQEVRWYKGPQTGII